MISVEGAPEEKVLGLRYGRGDLTFRLARGYKVKEIVPPRADCGIDVGELLSQALKSPIGSASLEDLAGGARRAVISIPDGTRPPVAREVLPAIIARLVASGLDLANISIFVACGAHAGSAQEDLRQLVGERVSPAIPIRQNYARRASDFKLAGITRRGTPIMINNLLLQTDLNVVISAVTLHYFAGMGGGRKMIVPGACHFETVRANHSLAIGRDGGLDPACRSGNLDGNPVHEDMVEGMTHLRNIFMVNVVLDGCAGVRDITCGDGVASHLEAVRRARGLLELPVAAKCDLAIASAGGHPFDIDLIQTHKSIDHAAHSLRDGGALVMVAACSGGVGSDSFLPWFDVGDLRAVSRKLLADYALNGQTALALMRKLGRIRIILVSRLDRGLVERTGMVFASSPDEALAKAEALVGRTPLTYVFPAAWGILPVIGG